MTMRVATKQDDVSSNSLRDELSSGGNGKATEIFCQILTTEV